MPLGVEAQAFLARVEDLDRATGHGGGQRRMHLPGNVLFAPKAAAHGDSFHFHVLKLETKGGSHKPAGAEGMLHAAQHFHYAIGTQETQC